MQYTLVGNDDGTSNITVYVADQAPLAAHSSHPSFDAILAGVLKDDESVYGLFDIPLTAAMKFERLTERITAANGRLYLDHEEVHNSLADQVVRFLKEGVKDWQPLVNFYENVLANPNEHSRTELYGWLAKEDFTITPEGMIVGYKGVNRDRNKFVSTHAGTAMVNGEVYADQVIPNPLGAVVEMPRSEVHHAPGLDCSVGLHVGTHYYASTFAQVMLEVEVNPRDVVSVPNHDTNKMRVCRYKVIKVINKRYETAVKKTPVAKKNDVKAVKAAVKPGDTFIVKPGDEFKSTDPRRQNIFKVETVVGDTVIGKSLPLGITRKVKLARLLSRKYNKVTRKRS